ncbi:MAG: CDP-glycerol glycerophosphotransferase family protein, partial [Aquihabitans sp.]
FEGADLEIVDKLMGDLGAHCLIKPHPLAAQPKRIDMENLTVLSENDFRTVLDCTLYEVLAHADVLITDYSSVLIDFLLTQRPMVFAISDLDLYSATRGHYFPDLHALLPGPLVTDVAGLAEALAALFGNDDQWVEERREALALHHLHVDAGSAERVADLVERELNGT